jgi:hypothetical protein
MAIDITDKKIENAKSYYFQLAPAEYKKIVIPATKRKTLQAFYSCPAGSTITSFYCIVSYGKDIPVDINPEDDIDFFVMAVRTSTGILQLIDISEIKKYEGEIIVFFVNKHAESTSQFCVFSYIEVI